MRDAIESMKPPRYFAFGTALPKDMKRHRIVTDTSQWMTCKNVPKGFLNIIIFIALFIVYVIYE